MHGVPLHEVAPADWDFVIGVNVHGVINGIAVFVPRLKRHGEPSHIVNTASIGGLQVNSTFRTGPYSMTKYAVVALSEALEQELAGTGIGVSVLCPAAVDTEIHLSARSRPERMGGPFERAENHFMGEIIQEGLSGDAVGTRVLAAIRDGEFFILTHTARRSVIEARHRRIMDAFDRAAEWERSTAAADISRRRRAS
jgi:NAD(P)-dependent dehydrogenase (short-subunit alcohol dehydrogenase family)